VVRTYFNPREKVFRAKVQRFFRDMRKQVLANLSKVKAAEAVSGNGSPAGLLAPPRADPKKIVYEATSAFKRLLQLVGPVYDGVQKDAIESLAKDLGKLKVVNQDTPSLLALLRLKKMKIRRVSETVRKQLRAQIILSTKKGEGIEKLKERLKRVFKFANSRALTVARTEVSGTWSGTRFHGMKEEGTKKHRWIDSRDEVVRETHHKCSGEVREIGKPFPNGLIHPHDPDGEAGEVINCRCICVPV
jgi:SPP1 gp7 family putative phage head morphogenesis protein